jgi:hypothetical protein
VNRINYFVASANLQLLFETVTFQLSFKTVSPHLLSELVAATHLLDFDIRENICQLLSI